MNSISVATFRKGRLFQGASELWRLGLGFGLQEFAVPRSREAVENLLCFILGVILPQVLHLQGSPCSNPEQASEVTQTPSRATVGTKLSVGFQESPGSRRFGRHPGGTKTVDDS